MGRRCCGSDDTAEEPYYHKGPLEEDEKNRDWRVIAGPRKIVADGKIVGEEEAEVHAVLRCKQIKVTPAEENGDERCRRKQTRGEVISEQTAETVVARRRTRRIAEEIEGGLQRRSKEEDKEDHERDRRRRTRRRSKEGGGQGGS